MSYDELKSPTVDERVENGWGFLFFEVEYSTEISDWGMHDTTSLEKRVTAVVNASFSIE